MVILQGQIWDVSQVAMQYNDSTLPSDEFLESLTVNLDKGFTFAGVLSLNLVIMYGM